jgi:hypothetical protein
MNHSATSKLASSAKIHLRLMSGLVLDVLYTTGFTVWLFFIFSAMD